MVNANICCVLSITKTIAFVTSGGLNGSHTLCALDGKLENGVTKNVMESTEENVFRDVYVTFLKVKSRFF
jgi:hypothetical protein